MPSKVCCRVEKRQHVTYGMLVQLPEYVAPLNQPEATNARLDDLASAPDAAGKFGCGRLGGAAFDPVVKWR